MADIDKIILNNTQYDIRDSSVPSWAKQSTKPTYTANEVGALPSNTHIPSDVNLGSVAGKMYREDVNGSGNFTVKGNSGIIPSLVAGTYTVAIYAKSATSSYKFRFNFGSVSYELTSTDGIISDIRTITIPSGTFSGSVVEPSSGGVASNTILSVNMYDYQIPISTVGKAAVTNRYSDLDGTPTIPTVNNGTLTIQKNGTNVATFAANQSSNVTANITVPTTTSGLTNDSGFINTQIYLGTSPASDAASYNKTATVEIFPTVTETVDNVEVTKPKVGTIVGIKYLATNTYKTANSVYTLNVNDTGEFPMYYNNSELATSTSANTLVAGYLNRYIYYLFNGTQWVWLTASYDSNTTYSNVSLGQGYTGNCTTAANAVAKTAALSSYSLTTGGIVVVTFTNGNTATSPTLNINSKGAKAIYFRGAACPTDLIQAGDRVTMIYSSQYHIVSIARRNGNVLTADASANTIALKDNNTVLSTINTKSINGVSLLGQGDLTVVGSNQPTSVVTVNGGDVTQAMDANVLYIIGSSATPCTSLTFTLNAGGSNTTNYYHAIVTCATNMTFTKPNSVTLVDGREIPSFTAGSVFEFSILENQLAYFYTEA